MESNSAHNSSSQEKSTGSMRRTPSVASSAMDARSADIKELVAGLDRITDRRLEKQRFVPSGQKTDEISLNALGAKGERALGRRISEQDADSKTAELKGKPVEIAAQ